MQPSLCSFSKGWDREWDTVSSATRGTEYSWSMVTVSIFERYLHCFLIQNTNWMIVCCKQTNIGTRGHSTLEVTGVLGQQFKTKHLSVSDFSPKNGGHSARIQKKWGVKRWELNKVWPIFQKKYKFGYTFDKTYEKNLNFDEILSTQGSFGER